MSVISVLSVNVALTKVRLDLLPPPNCDIMKEI